MKKKLVTLFLLVCLMVSLISSAVAASDYSTDEAMSKRLMATLSTGLTLEEERYLDSISTSYIWDLVYLSGTAFTQAQHRIYNALYPNYKIGWDWRMSAHGVSPSSVVFNHETNDENITELVVIGDNRNIKSNNYHQYLRLCGATARANGTDAYMIYVHAIDSFGNPHHPETFSFKGSEGLILDSKDGGITYQGGQAYVFVTAEKPGIYILTAVCEMPEPIGLNYKSIEIEFISDDVSLPTPLRPKGDLSWNYLES